MKNIFINKDSKLRSGWKIGILFIIVFSLLYSTSSIVNLIFQILLINKGQTFIVNEINKLTYSGWLMAIGGIISNLCFIVSAVIMWKVFEKSKISNMGIINIKYGYKDLLFGLFLGAISMIIVTIMLLLFGNVSLSNGILSPNIRFSLVTGLILFIAVGFGEEILGRAYIMSVLKQTNNKALILIISAIIFSLLHGGNPNVTLLALVNIFLVGLLFGYMYLKLDNIWMPIGYHITWNYFQGYIFGFQVSGTDSNGMYAIKTVSNNVFNGGKFGPEGGLAVTIVILLGFVIINWYCKAKKDNKSLLNKKSKFK